LSASGTRPESAGPSEEPGAARSLRRDLRLMVGDAVAFSVMVGVGEAYVPAFTLAAGHGDAASGLVATLPMLVGSLLQLTTPWGVAWLRSHRRWVVAAATGQALSFAPLVLGALRGDLGLGWIFLAAVAYWGFGMAAGPAWNTWVDDLVPTRIRPRYFAARNRTSQAVLLVSLTAGGALLHRYGGDDSPLAVFALLFAAAAVARLASSRLLARQSEPHPELPEVRQVALTSFFGRLRGTDAGRLLRHLLAMQLAVHIAAPYFTPYMLRELGLSYGAFTALTAAAFVSRVAALPLLGRVAQRFGSRALLRFGATGIAVLPPLWLLSNDLRWLFAVQLLSGLMWAAFELSALLSFFEGIDRRERTSVLTLFNFANAAAIAVGSLVGGAFFRWLPADASVYASLFVASSAARAVALRLLYPVGTLRLPQAPVVLRTLALRPALGAIQRPIVASLEPSEVEAGLDPLWAPSRLARRAEAREDEAARARVEHRQDQSGRE
jgi:MFS family permease